MRLSNPTQHYQEDARHFDYFEERSRADADAARRIQQAVFSAARLRAGERILDLGSGNGWLAEDCARRGLPVPVAVDIGVRNLVELRTRHGNRVLCVAADATMLPFRDGSFERIIASEVLEHVNEPPALLREAWRCLRGEGRLVVSTPYRERLRYALCIHCNQVTPLNAHLHSFDEEAHLRAFAEAGFVRTGFERVINKLFLYSRLSSLLFFLPFPLWRILDRLSVVFIRKWTTIIVSGSKT